MVADRELYGAGDGASDQGGDDAALVDATVDEATEDVAAGAQTPASVDPREWLNTEEGQAVLARDRAMYSDRLARKFRQAAGGDVAARDELLADRNGRRMWESHEQRVTHEADARARTLMVAESEFQRIGGMDRYERDQLFEGRPDIARWYADFRIWRGSPAQSQQAQQATTARSSSVSEADAEDATWRAYDRIAVRAKARGLTDADLASVHPSNFDNLEPDEAIAAMADAYAELTSARGGSATTAKAPAKPGVRQVIANAVAKAPPGVNGRAAIGVDGLERWQKARDSGNLVTQADREAYAAYRKQKGWS